MKDNTNLKFAGISKNTYLNLTKWINKYPRKRDLCAFKKDSEILDLLCSVFSEPAIKDFVGKGEVENSHDIELFGSMLWIIKHDTNPNKIRTYDILLSEYEKSTIILSVKITEFLINNAPQSIKIEYLDEIVCLSCSSMKLRMDKTVNKTP